MHKIRASPLSRHQPINQGGQWQLQPKAVQIRVFNN